MKNHSTKPSTTQSVNNNSASKMNKIDVYDLKECTDAASRFLSRFDIVKLLGECGTYKEK